MSEQPRLLAIRPRVGVDSFPLPEIRPDAESAGAATAWLASLEGRKAPRTIAQYVGTVNDLLRELPDLEPQEITDGHLEQFLARYPIRSRSIRRSHLNSFFKYLRRRRLIPENPIDFIEDYPQQPKQPVRVFSLPEINALRGLPRPDGELMQLLFDLGLRAGEARRLQVRNVLLDEGCVEIVRSKRGKTRLVPLTQRSHDSLYEWFVSDGMELEAFLWYCSPGGHYRDHTHAIVYSSFVRWWRRCLDSAGVEYRCPHTMRHSYGTWSKRAGVDTNDLRENLGHSKLATTLELYVHTTLDDRLESAAIFEAGTS